METTPALRNNWDFATAPSPQTVLGTALAPIAGAVDSYNQRAFEIHAQNVAAQNAARLQQLKVDATLKGITARDSAVMAWHDAQDQARIQAAGEAQRAKGVADARDTAVKYAQARNLPVLPMQPNETVEGYTARQNAANTAGATVMKKNTTEYVKQQMLGLADVYNRVNGLKSTITKEAGDSVAASLPSWVAQQDPADPRVVAYNSAIKRGAQPPQALASSGLGPTWQQYAQSQTGLMAEKIMSQKGYDKNLSYLQTQAQQYGQRLQQISKTNPDYPEIFTGASQSISDETVALAKKASDAADAARAGGNTDPQTQAQLDARAQVAKDAAAKATAAHEQLKVSIGATLGGQPIDRTAPVKYPAATKEDALAQLGVTLDANNQIQQAGPGPLMTDPTTGAPISTGAPATGSLDMAKKIIMSPTLPWATPRPGLPGIQPGQASPAAAPTASATTPVSLNPFTLPRFSVADLINNGVIAGPTAPAPTPAAPSNNGLTLPPLSSDDTAASILQGNGYLAQQLMQ